MIRPSQSEIFVLDVDPLTRESVLSPSVMCPPLDKAYGMTKTRAGLLLNHTKPPPGVGADTV